MSPRLYFIHCGTYQEPFQFGSQYVSFPGSKEQLIAYLTPILRDMNHPKRPILVDKLGNLDLSNSYIPAPGVPAPEEIGLFQVEESELPVLPL